MAPLGHQVRLLLPLLLLSTHLLSIFAGVSALKLAESSIPGSTPVCDKCRCSVTDAGLLDVNCSKADLASLAGIEFPPNTDTLILDSNTISLGADCFGGGIRNLSSLSLKHNNISVVHEDAFRGLPNLRKLDLSANALEYLPEGVFSATPLLETLHLQFNPHLSAGGLNASLKHLQNLETLDVAATGFHLSNKTADAWITMLPGNFVHLNSLKHLNLESVGLRDLGAQFFKPMEDAPLTWLSLAGNQLREIHNTTFTFLSSLKYLDLSHTYIDYETTENVFNGLQNSSIDTIFLVNVYAFDDEDSVFRIHTFRPLENTGIRVLHLENNYGGLRGEVSHRLFRHLDKLEELYLDACMIHKIEYNAFQRLDKLRVLSLRYNFLNCVRGCGFLIGSPKLPILEILDLTGNVITQLGEIEGTFEGSSFPRLRWLSLRNNRLSSLSSGVFVHLKHLNHLDLSVNPLVLLAPGTFSFHALPSLHTLLISDCNQLVHLFDGTFGGLARLDRLELERNGLQEVDVGAFAGLNKLQSLSLRDNNLADVEIRLDSRNLTRLDLGRNNLQKVPRILFAGNVSSTLNTLLLDHNRIATVTAHDFGHALPNVTYFDVSHNSISRIHVTLGAILPALQQINLAGNPILCDCHVNASFSWLHQSGVTILDKDDYFCSGHDLSQNIFEYRPPSWQCWVEGILLPVLCFFIGALTVVLLAAIVVVCRRLRRTPNPHGDGNGEVAHVEEGRSRRESGNSCTNNGCYPLLSRRRENGDVDTQRALLPEAEENQDHQDQQAETETAA